MGDLPLFGSHDRGKFENCYGIIQYNQIWGQLYLRTLNRFLTLTLIMMLEVILYV